MGPLQLFLATLFSGAGCGKPDPNGAIAIKEKHVRSVLDRNLLGNILTCYAVA